MDFEEKKEEEKLDDFISKMKDLKEKLSGNNRIAALQSLEKDLNTIKCSLISNESCKEFEKSVSEKRKLFISSILMEIESDIMRKIYRQYFVNVESILKSN